MRDAEQMDLINEIFDAMERKAENDPVLAGLKVVGTTFPRKESQEPETKKERA